jgi:hypothetical protein
MPLWRYMSFAKLVSLLDRQALYFSRLDRLGDPFEGSITLAASRRRKPRVLNSLSPAMFVTRNINTVVNCWHASDYESAAMWQMYSPGGQGVAIRSTIERLASSLPRWDGIEKGRNSDGTDAELFLNIAAVSYIDYDSGADDDLPAWALLKRRSFEFERELRAYAFDTSFQGDPHPSRFPDGGAYVPVSLERLIERVHVAPSSPTWYLDAVAAVARRFGIATDVVRSDMDAPVIR